LIAVVAAAAELTTEGPTAGIEVALPMMTTDDKLLDIIQIEAAATAKSDMSQRGETTSSAATIYTHSAGSQQLH
jgi:hypothetical protein